ncbi:MAG: YlxM family DNA-binding protein [Firmicutes bacterium]|nr:YlxM family DNA-binding protein [Bacillota bacterium]
MVKNMGEISMLFDFYGDLLTDRQKMVLDYYYGDDYTLSEIAEYAGISRQAVHDTVHKAEKALRSYESVLGLVSRYRKNSEDIRTASGILERVMNDIDDESIRERLSSVREILNGLE